MAGLAAFFIAWRARKVRQMQLPNDDTLLTTEELSAAFAALNLPLAVGTLEVLRCRGNGPPFEKYGRWVRYRWGAARDWRLAQRRVLTSTAEAQSAA
jgi:hypothetical protein